MKKLPTLARGPLPPGRKFGYARASKSTQIASPAIQKNQIEEYARRQGWEIDDWFVDPATSSKLGIFDRPAGKLLLTELRQGDTLIVAKLDRLSRGHLEFANTLDVIEKRGVVLHVVDMPGGVFDPGNPISALLIYILVAFAQHERTMIRTRTREALQTLKQNGERHCRYAQWGWQWERRWDSRKHKYTTIQVPCERERMMTMKAVEMRAQGYSIDQIRQYFNYEWKQFPRPLKGKTTHDWDNRAILRIVRLGAVISMNGDWKTKGILASEALNDAQEQS